MAPTSFTLSVSSNGGAGFSFVIDDVSSPPSGVRVMANFSAWENGLPSIYTVEVQGERGLGSSSIDELIAIAGDSAPLLSGDGAEVDIGQFSNVGVNTTAGTWTQLPEPSAAASLILISLAGVFGRRRNVREKC